MMNLNFFNIVLTIINQFMTDTLNTYHRLCYTSGYKQSNNVIKKRTADCMLIFLVLLFVNLPSIQAKQTVIVESLASKNDKILAKLLEETNSYIEYQRLISSITFQCKTILKNQLTKNNPENITKIGLHLDYAQVMSLDNKEILLNYQAEEIQQTKQLDKILNILNGQCLYYTTSTFIYQYCHKEHVRQLDTALTKNYNAKQEFQDISLGLYNPEQYKNKQIKKGIVELTADQRKVTIPQLSNFSKDYNFLFIDGVDSKLGQIEFQESEDGNYLFSNSQLFLTQKYLKEIAYFIIFHCEQIQFDGSINNVKNYALLIDPYTFVYTSKQGRCDRHVSYSLLPKIVIYQADDAIQPIRVYGKYLYGNVQQVCTANWGWQKDNSNKQFDNNLEQGSLLLIELYNSKQKQQEYHYVTIKRIISESLIQLETPLGKSFKVTPAEKEFINKSTIGSQRLVTNITKCQLLFKKKINLKQTINLSYVSNGIVNIEKQAKINKGTNIGCICKSFVSSSFKIIDLDITIVNNIFLNYYKTIVKSNTYIYSNSAYHGLQYLLRQCQDYTCFPLAQLHNNDTENDSQKKGFTQIITMSKNRQFYHFNSSRTDNLYILSIKNSGIIKLTTRSKDGLIYTYLITEGQIIKIIQFANGTKQIIKQNKFYENSTFPSDELHKNYVYIKISRLPNGSYYGGIWKTRDFVYFPRFTLFDEQLISLQRTSGQAYLRILNLDNLKNKQHMAVVAYMKKLQNHYSMKEKKKAQPTASQFLNKSYSINYKYVSGKYCDPPVNKFRTTTVNLKCGSPWFSISKLLEKSPCEYFIEIQTTLLCRQGYKQVLQSDENLFNRKGNDVIINNGVFCQPSKGIFDQVTPYFYLKKSFQNK